MKPAVALIAVAQLILGAQTTPPQTNAEAVGEREWGKQSGPFQLSIAADKRQYGAEEVILLTATLKNVGSEPVMMHHVPRMLLYEVNVWLPMPAWIPYKPKAPLTQFGDSERHPRFTSVMGRVVPSGYESVDRFELNKLFQMSAPGEYRVVLSCRQPSEKKGEPEITVTSNEIVVTVLPAR